MNKQQVLPKHQMREATPQVRAEGKNGRPRTNTHPTWYYGYPRSVLTQLCTRLGIPFEVAMLKWPAGPKPEDGVWGQHWYERVHRSTGFDPHRAGSEQFPDELVEIYKKCAPLYDQLMEFAIRT